MTKYGPRADQVGSLRRPDSLLATRASFHRGELSREELRLVEDESIIDALRRQHDAGVDVVSDGEFRRDAWQTDISEALDGFDARYPISRRQREDGTFEEIELHTKAIEGRLHQRRRITAHEVGFMKDHADGPFKITMPSPNMVVWGSYKLGVTDAVYASRDELRGDLIPIYQAELDALQTDGVEYVQLDEGFTRYVNPTWRDQLRASGVDPVRTLAGDIATENAIYDTVDRTRVVLGSHLCRGSRTTARGQGTYDELAEMLFSDLHVDRFLLEYDSDEFGGFEPLRFLPKNKTVVLGLVTSKHPELEDQDGLIRRIESAAKFCSLDQLAISPQCGFGGSADNDFMSYERQFEKLENLALVAQHVWG